MYQSNGCGRCGHHRTACPQFIQFICAVQILGLPRTSCDVECFFFMLKNVRLEEQYNMHHALQKTYISFGSMVSWMPHGLTAKGNGVHHVVLHMQIFGKAFESCQPPHPHSSNITLPSPPPPCSPRFHPFPPFPPISPIFRVRGKTL